MSTYDVAAGAQPVTLEAPRPKRPKLAETWWRHLVGIVAVVVYNYFQARVERIDATLQIGSARIIEAVMAGRRPDGVR